MRYRPGLDGIRALAVAAVMVLHAGYFDGGYQGVDVFFVLSGYLITSILLAEHGRRSAIDLRAFYIRRFLRLYPALAAAVTLVALISFAASYEQHRDTALAGLTSLTYVENIAQLAGHGFSFFLDHTWSLAVEEQFYLVWPLVLLVLLRRRSGGMRSAARTLLTATAVLLLLRAAVTLHWNAVDARLAPPTDSAGLILGAALAARPVAWARSVFAPAGALIGFVVVSVWAGGASDAAGTWGPTVTTAAAGLLVAHVVAEGPLTGALGLPAAVWIGRRSYGLYLYHFPIQAVMTFRVHERPAAAIATAAASLAAAALSYRFVEQPFLRRKQRFERVPASGRPDA